MNRYLLPLAAVLSVSAIALMNCGPAGNCSPANCGGCCDATGTCVTATTASACGRLGATCNACTAPTNVCMAGVCAMGTTGGGTGGGSGGGTAGGSGGGTGGGSGGGTGGGSGGGAPSCVAMDFSAAVSGGAQYSETANGTPNHQGLVSIPSATQGRFNLMVFESWYFGTNSNPTFPQTVTTPSPMVGYADCADCIYIDEDCDNMGANCARSYYVQGGSMVINTATRNVAAGTFALTATNLNFVEWDFSDPAQGGDRAVSNGRCITVATVSLNSSWAPADGGVVTDAGTDAGVVVDAGVIDAGVIDAGVIDAGVIDAGVIDAGTDVDAGLDDAGTDAG
jgi:hypothetical protein